jgi:type III pantothenate kinase
MLAIDSGNTRTKWAVFADDGRIQATGVCVNAELAAFEIPASWQTCKHAIAANVAGEGVAKSITTLLKKAEIAFVWAKAEAETLGLSNQYQAPETLSVTSISQLVWW